MADERETESSPPPAARGRLRWLLPVLGTAAFVALPLLLAVWLLASASGLVALAAVAERLSGGALVVEGAQGRLLGPLRIGRLAWRAADARIEARDLALDWRFAASPRAALFVPTLDIATLDVATRPSDTPPALPDHLGLPFALDVERMTLGRLRLQGWGADPAPTRLELADLYARFAGDARRLVLSELQVVAPFATLRGEAALDAAAPFRLDARLRADGERDAKTWRIDARAKGPLDALAINAKASGWNLAGEADIALTPFAAVPLRRARLALAELDPAAFSPGAPHAALRIRADLAPRNAAAPESLDQWELAGPVEVVNREPAPFDRRALPFARLDANALWRQGRLALDDLVLSSPPGKGRREPGRLTGSAQLDTGAAPRLRLQLTASALDPRSWVSTLKPARLAGTVTGDATAEAQTLEAALRESGTRVIVRAGPPWQAELALRHHDGMVDVTRLRLTAGAAALAASGRLRLDEARGFEVAGKLTRFDPSLYADVPRARLTADLAARGALAPALHAELNFDLHDSQLATPEGMRALAGKGALRLAPGRLAHADVALDLAGNRLAANGAFGGAGDTLAFTVDAPQLDAIGMGLAGRVEAQGSVGGTLALPSGEVKANASALRVGDAMRIDAAALHAQLREGRDGRFDAKLELTGVRRSSGEAAQAEKASLSVAGTRGDHSLQGSAALGGDNLLRFAAQGALLDGPAWQGRVDTFELAWRGQRLALARPAALAASAERVELGAAELRGASARLRLEEAHWTPAGWATRGAFSGLQVGVALDAQQQATLRGRTLTLGGEWNLRAAPELDGTLALRREAGDLALGGDIPVEFGLRDLVLQLEARQGALEATLAAAGDKLGQLDARVELALKRDGRLWQIARHAPLRGQARFAMPSVAWIGPLLGPNVQLDGALGGSLTLAGTPAAPDARGNVRAAGLSLALVEQGLRLTDGEIDVELTQERARLARFDFRADPRVRPNERRIAYAELAGRPGRLTGSGDIDLASGKGALRFQADRLAVLQRPDRWLMMSGEAQLATAWDALALSGRLRADAGYFEFAATAPPTLDDDVVIVGRQRKTARPLRFDMDLALDLGRRLYFKGRGLDARLSGDLRLRADARTPLRASGSIQARDGTYDAYGQYLTIERGIINFQGPLDNAGLNVRALRTGLPVEAGVEITGTVRAPRVRLVSDPQVPDSEKLSWIVLGRGQDQTGGADSALLLSAAGAILGGQSGGQGGISRQLAQGLGLDQISVTSGDLGRGGSRLPTTTVAGSTLATRDANLTSQIVTLGKRISADAYLSYEQSLAGAASVVKLTYALSRRLSVIGRAGTDSSIDLLYSISFR